MKIAVSLSALGPSHETAALLPAGPVSLSSLPNYWTLLQRFTNFKTSIESSEVTTHFTEAHTALLVKHMVMYVHMLIHDCMLLTV